MGFNVNCKKCDKFFRCHHPKIEGYKFLWLSFRPECKLLSPYKETIKENGDVILDNKCEYQETFPRPKFPPRGGSGEEELKCT